MLFIVILVLKSLFCITESSLKTFQNATTYELGDHTVVSSSNVFPYVAAILNKSKYLCAGALIDESWVLTVADSVFLFRDSLRLIHVRLGSINNKQGGKLMPIKLIEFHPFFDDQKPEFDIALIQLGQRVRLTANLNPIRLQRKRKNVMATHFIVTAWSMQHTSSAELYKMASMQDIQRRRMLRVAHLHPSKKQQCDEVLDELGFLKSNIMCLDPTMTGGTDPCSRDVGAPVVLNGILWGVLSSWVPEDCDLLPGPTFVVLTSAPNITSWIHATLRGIKWHKWTIFDTDYEEYEDDD
ncbi:trypsin 5G1-like [Leguminivora glycinivorella]|uniref:trypsin 5G1-like n=1 Tax=Leguminivora glycinivorella TaxID=1035111 RepID=UPI00200BD9F1|nr:trypsin 5G1-like [Leguminivora glycinivorella]